MIWLLHRSCLYVSNTSSISRYKIIYFLLAHFPLILGSLADGWANTTFLYKSCHFLFLSFSTTLHPEEEENTRKILESNQANLLRVQSLLKYLTINIFRLKEKDSESLGEQKKPKIVHVNKKLPSKINVIWSNQIKSNWRPLNWS